MKEYIEKEAFKQYLLDLKEQVNEIMPGQNVIISGVTLSELIDRFPAADVVEVVRTIYIAGRISGNEKYREQFYEAEERLREQGFLTINPACLPDDLPAEKYMPICLAMVQAADAVYMLDGWERSAGAQIERSYALYQKKKIYYESEVDNDK